MTTFHCPNCDARVILKNGEEPDTLYLKRLERLKEQARRLGDNQEVNELQDEIDQINREIKMNAGKTKDKKFSVKGKDAYDPTTPKNIAKAKALSVAQGKAASDAKVEVKQQSDVGSNQWGIYVDGKLVEGGFFSKSAAEEASVQYSKDEAYDPLDPENIAEEKELAKARGAAAADKKTKDAYRKYVTSHNGMAIDLITSIQGEQLIYKAIEAGGKRIEIPFKEGFEDTYEEIVAKYVPRIKKMIGDSKTKDSLFKGQKVTAIKSEQGLREGETYTVLGEEAIIKQIVGENDTTVYKLQDSSGNVIVIESPEGLFYEVKDGPNNSMIDAYDDGYEAAKNGKPISDNPFKDRSRSGWGDLKESWDDGWRNGNKNKDSKTKDKEEENESLKVKIGDIRKNMDAARKMGYDTEPYKKEIDKLECGDEERDQTGAETQEIAKNYRKLNRGFAEYDPEFAKGYFKNKKKTKDEWTEEEIKKRMKRISEEIDKIVLSGGVVGLGDPLSIEYGRLKSKLKNKTKDDNSKNGYYAAMTGKARTDNPFPKGTPENQKWDSDWKIGSEDFKYESNKELFKPKDSDDKELKEMLVNDAPDYYGAIVATARRGNNPQMGSKEVRKNLEPFMSAHGVQFNEEEFNKAYKEFNKAGVSKAAFMKGTDAKDEGAYKVVTVSGKVVAENLNQAEAMRKLREYEKENDELCHIEKQDSNDSSDIYTKDPLTKKGEKILAAMKKAYGEEKGEQIFYAAKNKGKISGVDSKTKDEWSDVLYKGQRIVITRGQKSKVDKSESWSGWVNINGKVYHTVYKTSYDQVLTEMKQIIDRNTNDSKTKDASIGEIVKIGSGKKRVVELYKDWTIYENLDKMSVYKYWATSNQRVGSAYLTAQGDNINSIKSEIDKDGKTKDQEIKIIIGDDPVTPSPAEQKVEGNDVIYKEYTLKQLPETGEFEVYAPGGSIVGHAKALELAKLFVDRIVASRVGDEWSEEARKKL